VANESQTPEQFDRETLRIWDWDKDGRVVQLDATVDLYYLPIGHPDNDKPFPRPEFNLVSLKTLDGEDYNFTDQLRRSIYIAIETKIQQEIFGEIEKQPREEQIDETENVDQGPMLDLGIDPNDNDQNAGQKKGRGRSR
jgi:hypothetical protein